MRVKSDMYDNMFRLEYATTLNVGIVTAKAALFVSNYAHVLSRFNCWSVMLQAFDAPFNTSSIKLQGLYSPVL
jgi:hypothetical protein